MEDEIQTYQAVYWVGSIILLSFGGASILSAAMMMRLAERSELYLAFIPVFMADISTVINLLPRDFYHLVARKFDANSGWCTFSAIWTICACVSLNVNAVNIAYVTRRIVLQKGSGKKSEYNNLLIGTTAFGWGLGLALALMYYGLGKIGNFHGLYCCLHEISSLEVAFPYFTITSIAIVTMSFFYRSAFLSAYEVYMMLFSNNVMISGGGAEKTDSQKLPTHLKALVRISVQMVVSFYFCWFPASVLAISSSLGAKYPVGLDIFAAWCLKMQPIIDSYIVISGVVRTLRKKTEDSHASGKKPKPTSPRATSRAASLQTSPSVSPAPDAASMEALVADPAP